MSGIEHGMDVSGGTIVTGGAMGDLSGYTLTLSGQERQPANFISVTAETATQLTLGDASTITVEPGSATDVDVDDDPSGIPGGGTLNHSILLILVDIKPHFSVGLFLFKTKSGFFSVIYIMIRLLPSTQLHKLLKYCT